MLLKRKLIFIIRRSLILLPVIFFILLGIYFYLPVYVGSHLIPQLATQAKEIGIKDLSCNVRGIGMTGTDFGAISIGKPEKSALSIASLQIDYTPKSLCQKTIDKIVFSGVDLYCGVRNKTFFLRGLDLNKILSQPSKKKESDNAALPIAIRSVEIRNAQVIFQWKEREYQIPVEVKIRPESSWKILDAEITLYPGSRKMILAAKIDLNCQTTELKLDTRGFLIERLSDVAAMVIQNQLVLSGELDVKAEAKLDLAPLRIISLFAESEFRNHGTSYQRFRPGKSPLYLKVHGKGDTGEWHLLASSFSLAAPVPVLIGSVQMKLDIIPPFRKREGIITYDVNLSDAKADGNAIKIPSLVLQGKIEANRYTFDLKASKTQIATDALNVSLPYTSFSGKFNKENQQLDSTTTIRNADFLSPLLNLKIDDIQAVIPLKIPCRNSGAKGNLSAKRLYWNQMNMGHINGFIRQKSSDFMFEINNDNKLIPKSELTCWGKFPIPFGFKPISDEAATSEIHLWLSRNKSAPDIDLGRFFPGQKGVILNGELNAKLNWIFDPAGMKSSLRSSLNHGMLRYDMASADNEAGIAVKGISLSFSMPDLAAGCSAPKQQLFFKNASFGNTSITDGKIDFQLESGGAFLIEKSSFRWCNGKVSSEALRILPGADDYNLILYCDRLNLAKVLEQFGAGNAEGKGAVSGRIPLRFKNGEFIFNDGFLFSTPGDGGTIHITNTDMLTAGIPKDTIQYAQIDLAREALKNFEYKWVKLRLNTEKENLKLKLQFDGKPANPLPFVYNKEFGGFARVESGTKSSHFQGISLDVNMGLPLNKILQYKEILKSF